LLNELFKIVEFKIQDLTNVIRNIFFTNSFNLEISIENRDRLVLTIIVILEREMVILIGQNILDLSLINPNIIHFGLRLRKITGHTISIFINMSIIEWLQIPIIPKLISRFNKSLFDIS